MSCRCNCESFGAHVRSLQIQGPTASYNRAKDRDLDRDLSAYKRLRAHGQPRHTTGAARVEATASTLAELEGRPPEPTGGL